MVQRDIYIEILTDFGGNPCWLSDSRRLVFVRGRELWLVDRESRKARKIYSSGLPIGTISVSRDDRAIYFTSASVEGDVWLMKMADP